MPMLNIPTLSARSCRRLQPLVFVLFLAALLFADCRAAEFYTEDTALTPAPERAIKAILQYEKGKPIIGVNGQSCKFIGKNIELSNRTRLQVMVVTTDQGCGCGNVICPIWVLFQKGDSYSVIVSDGGYSMKTTPGKSSDWPDIRFDASAAGWTRNNLWTFKDGRYVKSDSTPNK